MPQTELVQILKRVSRSFYLSIRILPDPMRNPVGIAYLLARAADSITDSDTIPVKLRKQYLLDLSNCLLEDTTFTSQRLSKELPVLLSDSGEQALLACLPEILLSFQALNSFDKKRVQDVVNTLIRGMKQDLSTFNSLLPIVALENPQALDEYTYLVAGCVGEFWTTLAIGHLSSVAHWDEQIQIQLGIKFGKALQMTNILRDVAKDVRLGRCYLPENLLDEHNLSVDQLLDKSNDDIFRPLINEHLLLTLKHFNSAEAYLLSTPRTNFRLRLASIWPILIGLETLKLIADKKNYLDYEQPIKVQRKWVYSMLFRSILVMSSNTLLTYWITHLKQKIRHNIQCQS